MVNDVPFILERQPNPSPHEYVDETICLSKHLNKKMPTDQKLSYITLLLHLNLEDCLTVYYSRLG